MDCGWNAWLRLKSAIDGGGDIAKSTPMANSTIDQVRDCAIIVLGTTEAAIRHHVLDG
jgi:hypothetical protein